MSAAAARAASNEASDGRRTAPVGLTLRARLRDGRVVRRELDPERHRRIQLGLLHSASDGFVELAAGPRPPGGKVRFITRRDPGHFLPGGATATRGWLEDLLDLAARHVARGDEVAVAPAVRTRRAAGKQHVSHTNWLWIDVDGSDRLPALRELLRRKPAHLLIASAGSGGMHVYWHLREPLGATPEDGDPRGATAIERAHERLIYAPGYELDSNGRPRPTVADAQCRDRARIMRLAGSVNGKSGAHAQIVWADFALAPWDVARLVGDLPEPPAPPRRRRRGRPAAANVGPDPYKAIAPPRYFEALAGIEVPASGLVRCPNPDHEDRTPSCHVGDEPGEGWCCFGCGAGGAIYDLASVVDGGPTGAWLRGESFARARARVVIALGEVAALERARPASAGRLP